MTSITLILSIYSTVNGWFIFFPFYRYARIYNENRCKINNSLKFLEKSVSIALECVHNWLCNNTRYEWKLRSNQLCANWDNNRKMETETFATITNRVLISNKWKLPSLSPPFVYFWLTFFFLSFLNGIFHWKIHNWMRKLH